MDLPTFDAPADAPLLPTSWPPSWRSPTCRTGLHPCARPPRAHPPLPGAAGADLRAPSPGVLRAGVQLRRDLPRDAGPRDPTGRAALRRGDRPQAAARALHLRGHVRVLRHHRALVGTRRRDARGGAHRAAARRRSAQTVGTARELDRGRALRARDGRVRTQRRASRELRGLHVAVDDGGSPVRATRAWRSPRESPSRSRRSPNRPARPRCSRSSTCSRADAGSAVSRRSPSASR